MCNRQAGKISIENTALILIDLQERFVPHIHESNALIERCAKLIKSLSVLGVPIIVTEQYPEGLGRTVGPIRVALEEFTPLEKVDFSIFEDTEIAAEVERLGRPNLLIGGIEAHICVIQSAVDAIERGYKVHWLADAVSSRMSFNVDIATQRAIQSGAFVSSTEMAIFQLMKSKNTPGFSEISKIIR